ncbi:MAG: M20/M25/M40 family metallo-hydrolase [Anaerolineae bacterium]
MKTRPLFWIIVWLSLVAIACNLSSTAERPPTLVPRVGGATVTAPPTLGFSTPLPGATAQPGVAVTASVAQTKAEIEMYNLLSQVESDRLMLHVENLVGFQTRHVNSSKTDPTRGIGAAFNYIMSQFLAIQAEAPDFFVFPEGHEFKAVTGDGIESIQHNAVAILQGTEANAGVVVIGAHYDSRTDDLLDANAFAPGAADNGSGVAAVLELARVLSKHPQRATIIFVLFSAEEHNRQGSRAFVADYILPLNDPNVVMLNLDTIGNWNDSRGNINDRQMRLFSAPPNDSTSRQLARTIKFLGATFALNVESDMLDIALQDQIDREGRFGDHESFYERGFPAIRFIEALEDSSMREGRDELRGVEPAYMTRATKTVLGVVLGLAGGPRPPQNITLRDNGNGTASLVWESVPGATSYIVALRRPGALDTNTHWIEIEPRTANWDKWWEYEAVYVAAVDESGMIGPLSREFRIR